MDPGTVVSTPIDIRPTTAYNGWRLRGEKRGGHIKGAKSLPYKWLKYLEWPEIVEQKGIGSDQKNIVYGYQEEESRKVAEKLGRLGFGDVSVYDGFVSEWCEDESLPMERMANYRQLVSAEWVQELLTSGSADEYDSDLPPVVCHAFYRDKAFYDAGHIPGAVPLDTNWLESTETWNRRSPEELKEVLESLGISFDRTVILYGTFSNPDNDDPYPGSSAGHLGSIRCAAIMMYAGVRDVRVIDGGFQSWVDAGFPVSTEDHKPEPVSDFGIEIPGNPDIFIDTPRAKEVLASYGQNLVSVRSWREFIGEVSGYNYIEKTGRIPGAVFGDCGSDAYHMENYRNLDHTTREYHEIEAMLNGAGIKRNHFNAFYCGTGWRGSEAFFNAWLMGWPNVAVYDGGWFEWSSDPTNPIEKGIPD